MDLAKLSGSSLTSEDYVVEDQLPEQVLELALAQEPFTSQTYHGQVSSVEDQDFHTLPVEVIERIIKYTFLRRGKLTPSSDPFHLNNTSHLLLVSKGFRDLCLPSFYSSINVSRPSHYVTFFDPKDGLFVGQEGRKRWAFVRELAVVREIFPPLVEGLPTRDSDVVPFLADLDIPSGRSLDVVCVIDQPRPMRTVGTDPEITNLVALMQRTEPWRSATRHRFAGLDMNIEVGAVLEEEIMTSAVKERSRFFKDRLLPPLEPLELAVSIELQGGRLPIPVPNLAIGAYTHLPLCYTIPRPITEPTLDMLILGIALAQYRNGRAPRIRLESFPSSLLSEFTIWIRSPKKDLRGRLKYPSSNLFSWTKTFSWELDDGTSFSIDAPILDDP